MVEKSTMSTKPIPVAGRVVGVTETDAARLSVVVLRGNVVLATSQIRADGSYLLALPNAAARSESPFALQLAVLPTTAAGYPDHVADAPRVTLKREALENDHPIKAPHLTVDPAIIDRWSIFWREWCVSGTMVGPNGCPAPGADVTVYTVTWGSGGYSKYARASVTTGPDGTFSLCFPWWDLLFPCWPCEPFWWRCWPWWWEFDILHIIEALETRAVSGAHSAALFRPEGSALIRGQGFASAARIGVPTPDPARTRQIASKFANPALRALFPWRWWCCDQPNIIFGATQNGVTILAEDPSMDTRWCMGSGQSVTLTGNQSTLTTCQGGPLPETGYVWTSVGDTLTTSIDASGLAQNGGDMVDVAFQGTLALHAAIAPSAFDYYQVSGSVWAAPKSRGGTEPGAGTGTPIGAPLWLEVWIFDPATLITSHFKVQMGPFAANGWSNLYATTNARQTLPAPGGLPPFPPVPPGGQVFWSETDLALAVDGTTLLGGIPFGAVDLTLLGFDQNFDPVSVSPDAPLTLTIDNTPFTTQAVNPNIVAWRSVGVPATNTGTGECPAYDLGPTGFVEITVTAQDNNGYVYQYELCAQYGNGNSPIVTPPGTRGYISNPLIISSTNPDYVEQSWVGGTETFIFPGSTLGGSMPPDCCYEFLLRYGKRVTDGVNWPEMGDGDFQTINLKFST